MTGYWDIHNHILPGVDDGSGCMRETMEMLEEEYRQGVRHIVFTPHYRRGMFAIPREEIQTVYARVCEMAADRFPEMEFYLGCEYYIHSDASVERLRGNPKYYMAGSRTVLMEFAYEASYAWIMQTVSEVRQMGLQPVVAHAERYECLYKGRDRVAELKTQGAYIQINCESILGKCGRKAKHFCMKLLKEDQIDLMASDAHDTEYRIVNIREAAELISRKFGQEKVETIFIHIPKKINLFDRLENYFSLGYIIVVVNAICSLNDKDMVQKNNKIIATVLVVTLSFAYMTATVVFRSSWSGIFPYSFV